MEKKKRLFYDIETSQIIFKGWWTGKGYISAHQIIKPSKIISVHWKWEGEEEVHHLDWGLKKQCDKKLLTKFLKEFNRADEIVAHNGDKFDLKWVRARAMKHDIEMNSDYTSIDTLKISKSKIRIPSHSLKEICKYFGLPSKLDAGGIGTWDDVQFKHSQEALDHLLYYGDGDIISLEAVFNKFRPYIRNKSNYSVLKGGSKFSCPECGSNHVVVTKTYTTAAGTIQHYMRCEEKECKQPFKINNKTYMDLLQYRMLNSAR